MLRMIRRIISISGKNKNRIYLGIFFNLLKAISVSSMLLAVYVIAENLEHLNRNHILTALGILGISIFGRFLFQWLMNISMSATGFDMFRDYRLEIGEKLKKAPMGYFSEQRLGAIQTVLTSTMTELESYSMLAITDLTGGVLMTSILILAFTWISPPMAVLTLIGLIVGILVLNRIQSVATEHLPTMLKTQENLVTQSIEYIRGISVLRSFSNVEHSEDMVYDAFEKKMIAEISSERAVAGLFKAYVAVFKVSGCGIIFLAILLYLSGQISLSYCLMFLVSAFIVYSEFEQMGDGAFLSKKINGELDRLESVTDIPQLDKTKEELNFSKLDIELKEVSFAYENKIVLDHVSCKIPHNSSCAIVGPSGSGKTTLCNLITRFWDVKGGEVLVGGTNVQQITTDSLLKNISMVFQNVYLFHDTIRNNILFGNPEATKEQIEEAAKKARCHDFICSLPNGYDTVLGEGGATLSGGEKQRISIARAMLKDAPIVILDEATSGIDPENEHALLCAINELTKGKTLISIAHRLDTVRNADQILVMDRGRIVQKGTHKQLKGQPGIYSKFLELRKEAIGWKL